MDFTGPQMVLTIKVTSLAMSLTDGARRKAGAVLAHARWDEKALDDLPSPLEFFGYVFFFPCFLAGPVFEMSDYLAFIDGSAFAGETDKDGRPPTVSPSSLLPTAKKVGVALACGAVFQVCGTFPQSFYFASEFAQRPLVWRLGYAYVAQQAVKFKYYFAWLLAEGSCIASGLSYNGRDPADPTGQTIAWNRMVNVRPLAVETADSFKVAVENWNVAIATWLKWSVYHRIVPTTTRTPPFWAVLTTNMFSALWHGTNCRGDSSFVF